MSDNKQTLHDRLLAKKNNIGKIRISWNASDGGSRMGVTLLDRDGAKIDEWNDWLIMDSSGRTVHQAIQTIVEMVFGKNGIVDTDFGSFYANFVLC